MCDYVPRFRDFPRLAQIAPPDGPNERKIDPVIIASFGPKGGVAEATGANLIFCLDIAAILAHARCDLVLPNRLPTYTMALTFRPHCPSAATVTPQLFRVWPTRFGARALSRLSESANGPADGSPARTSRVPRLGIPTPLTSWGGAHPEKRISKLRLLKFTHAVFFRCPDLRPICARSTPKTPTSRRRIAHS